MQAKASPGVPLNLTHVVVEVRNGLVERIVANRPGIKVTLIDWDAIQCRPEGPTPEESTVLRNGEIDTTKFPHLIMHW